MRRKPKAMRRFAWETTVRDRGFGDWDREYDWGAFRFGRIAIPAYLFIVPYAIFTALTTIVFLTALQGANNSNYSEGSQESAAAVAFFLAPFTLGNLAILGIILVVWAVWALVRHIRKEVANASERYR